MYKSTGRADCMSEKACNVQEFWAVIFVKAMGVSAPSLSRESTDSQIYILYDGCVSQRRQNR